MIGAVVKLVRTAFGFAVCFAMLIGMFALVLLLATTLEGGL